MNVRGFLSDGSDLDSVRRRGLDRAQHTTAFYQQLDHGATGRRVKDAARLAFVAHAAAVHDGDNDLAAATLARFREASFQLAPQVTRAGAATRAA